jgi:NAD kinase
MDSILQQIVSLTAILRSPNYRLLVGSAGVLAASLVLRYLASKEAKLVSDLTSLDNEEFDVIIVGGGGCTALRRFRY